MYVCKIVFYTTLIETDTYHSLNFILGSTLNLVFGLQLSMARIGSTVNMNVMVPIYDAVGKFMTPGHRTLGMALLVRVLFLIKNCENYFIQVCLV